MGRGGSACPGSATRARETRPYLREIPLRKELFEELLESVQQGGKILRGEMKPSRVFEFSDPDVRAVHQRYGLTQDKFAARRRAGP